MKHQKTSLVVAVTSLLALGSLLSPCHADILASYEFTGASAAQTSGSATGTNVTFGAFTGGGAGGTIGFSGFTDGDQLGGVTYASGTAPGPTDTPDTTLTTQWSTDLEFWEDFTSPQSETPTGDGLVNWIFVLEGPPEHLFIRLQANQETTE